jgi:hypothetical protein
MSISLSGSADNVYIHTMQSGVLMTSGATPTHRVWALARGWHPLNPSISLRTTSPPPPSINLHGEHHERKRTEPCSWT